MQINKIKNNNQNFGARINLKSSGIAEYCQYLERCKDAPAGCFSSNKHIELFSKICDAFEKHPSNEILDTDVKYVKGYFNARGVVDTSRGRIIDIEPSRSDDGKGPMDFLFRKLLDKDNKNIFNKLLGKEHSSVYDEWWNTNIKPIWNDISDLYKVDTTTGREFTTSDFNRMFKHQFRKKFRSLKVKTQEKVKNETTKNESSETKEPFFKRLKHAFKIIIGK